PTTFLIDRRGIVRFISVGANDEEVTALGKMIKKLIEEPALPIETEVGRTVDGVRPQDNLIFASQIKLMRSLIYRLHIWLGLLVAVPVLAWASSGFLYAWPNAVEGGKVDTIDATRIRISPS